ncbi:hypothetical protein HERIO_445 [Hepatospora eriocheir]|uniref:Exocyst complex component Sec6 n=1 Tax=Hepatospora eriocheir TaxID=1081669 RepID=A0A1X0QD23_9MICR|nr:hypothetical protein HERIO_445 [Hepatospora eriocheir]
MKDLIEKKEYIENQINELKIIADEFSKDNDIITAKLMDTKETHNQILRNRNQLKVEFKEKLDKFKRLITLVNKYKNNQKKLLCRQYELQLENLINQANQIEFKFDTNIFTDFDKLKVINSSIFPIFDQKKNEYYELQKRRLKEYILMNIINNDMGDRIYNLNLLSMYENHFNEYVLFPYIKRKIELKFDYHFRGNKPTNRLDKPENMFDFFIKELGEAYDLYDIYKVAIDKEPLFEFSQIIELVTDLANLKVSEIMNSRSLQKRSLLLHFVEEYDKFGQSINQLYNYQISIEKICLTVTNMQIEFIDKRMNEIHQMSYVQWFKAYKELIKENFQFIIKYKFVLTDITLEDTISFINLHSKEFIDNLRFINREEIRGLCLIYSNIENLKEFISDEEIQIRNNHVQVPDNLIGRSLEILSSLNSDIFKLIKNLVENDADKLIRRLHPFNYINDESKRLFIIETARVLEDYKMCENYNVIDNLLADYLDAFILENVILSIRFTSNDFLEFRTFYNKLKNVFLEKNWNSDEGCAAIEALFDGRSLNTRLFVVVKRLYVDQ